VKKALALPWRAAGVLHDISKAEKAFAARRWRAGILLGIARKCRASPPQAATWRACGIISLRALLQQRIKLACSNYAHSCGVWHRAWRRRTARAQTSADGARGVS